MGYEIVYCGACQVQVRGADLEKGLALRVDGRAYCAKCAPAILRSLPSEKADQLRGRPPAPSASSRITSARLRALPHAPPPSTRKTVAPPNRKPLFIGSGVAVLVLIATAAVLMSGDPPRREEAERPPDNAATPKSAKTPANPEAAKALADLERFAASSSDPTEILGRCDEAARMVKGTPQEARLNEIRARATEAKKVQDAGQSITMGLEQVRSMRKYDPAFERKAEITRLLARMKEMGGPRQAEVQKTLDEYLKEADAAASRAREMAAWYRFPSAEALGRDDSGHGNHALSIAGARWNRSFGDGGPGVRFDGSGVMAVPISIRGDFTIAMRIRTVQRLEGTERQWWRGVGLVDAETPGESDDFGTSLLGSKFVFGVGKPDLSLFSKTDVNDGRWRALAATRDGRTGGMKLYVDGGLEGSATGPKGDRRAPDRLVLGGLQTGLHPYVGELDDVRLYVRVLSDAEIAELARGGK
jgi:concanavalin A-like lectin/glucanase superfamily protein